VDFLYPGDDSWHLCSTLPTTFGTFAGSEIVCLGVVSLFYFGSTSRATYIQDGKELKSTSHLVYLGFHCGSFFVKDNFDMSLKNSVPKL